MNDGKNKNLLVALTLALLIIMVFGATYAYFVAQTGAGQSANINVSANTTDSLMFEAGKSLSLFVTQANFGEGAGNVTDSTTAKAILVANNKTNTARYTYNLYLNISKNDFVYTTEENTPEIILQITKPDGTELTTLAGLNYVTVGNTSGFDITTKKGVINISLDKVIEVLETNTNHKTEEEWQIGITFVNLDSNQQENTNKSFVSKVMIQKDLMPTISSVCNGQNLANCIKENYELDNTIYYHNETLAGGAGDNSYRYAGPSDEVNNFVCFGSDTEECPNNNLYRIIGVFDDKIKLIKYDFATPMLLGTNGEYLGTETDAGTTTENLVSWGYKGTLTASEIGLYTYNYIGLEDKTGDNKYGRNDWTKSQLNTVNLNENFLNNIGSEWSSKISITTWSVGGIDGNTLLNQNVKAFYDIEQNKSKTYEGKVGLIYPSEYGYSVEPSYWTKNLYGYQGAHDDSWMNMKIVEWTIAPHSDDLNSVFYVRNDGFVSALKSSYGVPVRPSFSLVPDIVLTGGEGTKNNPYRIA